MFNAERVEVVVVEGAKEQGAQSGTRREGVLLQRGRKGGDGEF